VVIVPAGAADHDVLQMHGPLVLAEVLHGGLGKGGG
jgi:hypothetical protein